MIALMFRSFGQAEPAGLDGAERALLWCLALAFVVASAAMLLLLNLFSLPLGVGINFLGRDGTKFRFLQLFGRIPLIGFTLPVLFAFVLWRAIARHGAAATLLPSLATALLAIVLLALVVGANTALRAASRR